MPVFSTILYRTLVQYRRKVYPVQAGSGSGLLTRPASATAGVLARKALNLYLNETASRWENHSHSASLCRTCFALTSRRQSLAQIAPLPRATNLGIKANCVPFPAASFKSLYPKGRNRLR